MRIYVANIAASENVEKQRSEYQEGRKKYQKMNKKDLVAYEKFISHLIGRKMLNPCIREFSEARQADETQQQRKNRLRQATFMRCAANYQEEIKLGFDAKHTPMSFRTMRGKSTKFNEKGNVIIREIDEETKGAEGFRDAFGGRSGGCKERGPKRGVAAMFGGGMDFDDEVEQLFEESEPFNPNEKFFQDDEKRAFDEVIRDQVYNCLLYCGDLQQMMKQAYFIDKAYKNELHYAASAKVPFYMIFFSSPKIQDELAEKYLQNPCNAFMFVEYDQKHPCIQNNQTLPDPQLERKFYMKYLYGKMRDQNSTNNLLCIGDPRVGKSSRLNEIFNVNFEIIDKAAVGQWHDSIDVLFHCDELPMGFNLFDFHGQFANNDLTLIKQLFKWLPKTQVLVQVINVDYLYRLKASFQADGCFEKLSERLIIISNAFTEAEKEKIRIFKEIELNWTEEKKRAGRHFFEYGSMHKGDQAKWQDASVFKSLWADSRVLEDDFYRELSVNKQALSQQFQRDESEYEFLHGLYWYVEDALLAISGNDNYSVLRMSDKFRMEHRKVKAYLFDKMRSNVFLKRQEVFRFYMRQFRKARIDQQLKDSRLTEEHRQILRTEKQEILVNPPQEVHEVFKLYFDLLTMDRDTPWDKGQQIQDMLNLVEAYCKETLSQLFPHPSELNFEQMQERDEYVLDAKLFTREARHYTKSDVFKNKQTSLEIEANYKNAMVNLLEEGKAIEVIDGDIDKLDKESLIDIMKEYQDKHGRSERGNQLVVIAIIGPKSSGKSTLLNFLTGAKLHKSVGRSTKGVNAMLLRTEFEGAQNIMSLDTEGLFSIERLDEKFDRRLALFCFGVCNFVLVNIKGEMNSLVMSILQMTIFNLKQLKAIAGLDNLARPHFILRDLFTNFSTSAKRDLWVYDKIRYDLDVAAKAADSEINELITWGAQQDMMDAFYGAIDQNMVYPNDLYTQTKWHATFREQCCHLRHRLIRLCLDLEPRQRAEDLEKLVNQMAIVWSAVNEDDNLVLISDLRQINDQRKLEKAMRDFKGIMGKLDEGDADDYKDCGQQNPLLKGVGEPAEHLKQYKIIFPTDRLMAELFNIIGEAIRKLDDINENRIQAEEVKNNEDYIESIKLEALQKISDERSKWWSNENRVVTGLAFEMSNFFTEDMSPSLQEIGRNQARMHIESIYQRAKQLFAQEWAKKTFKAKMIFTQQKINQRTRNADQANLDEATLRREKAQIIEELQVDMANNLVSMESMREDCEFKLRQFCQELIAQKSNDFKCVGLDPYIDAEDRQNLKEVRFIKMLFDEDFEQDPDWQQYVRKMMIQPDDYTLRTTVERWTLFADPGQEESRKERVRTILQNKTRVMNDHCIELFINFKHELHELIQEDNQENRKQKYNERDLDQRALERYHELFRSLFKKFDQDRSKKLIKKDQCCNADCWSASSGDGYDLPYLCYKLNWEYDPLYSKICEYTILRRIEMQAERNKEIHEAQLREMISEFNSQLDVMFQ